MPIATCGKYDERDAYMELIHIFPLKPIRNDSELEEAMKMLGSLLDSPRLSDGAKQYQEVLESLIEKYEREFHDIPPVPDHELLKHLIDAKGVSQAEVARATGIVYSTISSVLAGRRPLTRLQVGQLSRYFNVPVETFSF